MHLSDRANVGNVGSRWGSPKALQQQGIPNLPNLPDFDTRPRTHVCTCERARPCTRACTPTHPRAFRSGRLGRLGRCPQDKGFSLPNLFPTFLTSEN